MGDPQARRPPVDADLRPRPKDSEARGRDWPEGAVTGLGGP